jgi:subtilase family serine protease
MNVRKTVSWIFAAALAGAALTAAAAGQGSLHAHSAPVCPGPAAALDARCHAQVVTDEHGQPAVTDSASHNGKKPGGGTAVPPGYGPVQLHAAYGLPATAAGVSTIAIVDAYNDPNIESDLAVYSSTFGLPSCTTANGCFKKVNQTGGSAYPQTNAGWALEIALDVEVAHATCQNCKILLVEASSNSFTNLLAAEDYATTHAQVVSNSWGGGESSGEISFDSHFNRPGVPITASSGDNGYGVEYPAASPYVVAVGGTTLRLNADNTRASEVAWSGAGSGCSAYEPKPAFQHDAGCVRRSVADASADADPNTGAAVYDSVSYNGRSGWFVVGGTSLAAPIIASVYALSGNFAGTNSIPYAHVASLYDVTSGTNGACGTYLCAAGLGYDGPTGLGTPVSAAAF